MPWPAPLGAVQVPPGCGTPGNWLSKSIAEALPQMDTDELVPLGGVSTVMVMQSVEAQPGCPVGYAVTQYWVVPLTVAKGLAMEALLKPVAGLQLYTIPMPGQLAVPLQTVPLAGLLPVYTTVPT